MGRLRFANAGHLPPYLNGQPIDLEGALPLGVIATADFSVAHFQLQENDRLVVASDGIVEAMNEQGQLFGFARVQQLLQTRLSAAGSGDPRANVTASRTTSVSSP